jgi:hypothetical protein
VHRGERERHERVSDGAHAHRARDVLALLARKEKVARGSAERQYTRLGFAIRARPKEEPRRPQLEAAELPELNLEAALPPSHALGRVVPFDQTHRKLNLYA